MSWDVADEEFESVLSLPAERRYGYFIKRVAGHGELWGLRGAGGWVVAQDDEGSPHLPLWPHPRFARACATGVWKDEEPAGIDVDDWVAAWPPTLDKDGLRIAVFQTPHDQGIGVSPTRLKADLENELAQLEL